MENIKACPKCSNEISEEDRFCSKCGAQIEAMPQFVYNTYVSGPPVSEETKAMKEFIGNEAEFYIDKFETMTVLEKNTSWNWAAFFLTPLWCFYRKLYILGTVVALISMLTSFVEGANTLLGLVVSIFIGATGNAFYKDHVDKHLAKTAELPYDERMKYYEKKGGTSYLAVFIGICGIFFLSYIRVMVL